MKPYHRGNKFSPLISFADAAVDLAHVPPCEYSHVRLDAQGMPHHLDSRELNTLANILLKYIEQGELEGYTLTEEGHQRRPKNIILTRKSFQAWRDEWASI